MASLYCEIRNGKIRVRQDSPDEHRFWSKVEKRGPIHPIFGRCWTWLGALCSFGYGHFSSEGMQGPVHRYSYKLHKGNIPDGLYVCHHCDNPSCVNPKHLFVGTPQDNMLDKLSKDRQPRYNGIGRGKLTKEQVIEIRNRFIKHSAGTSSAKHLAKEFNVSLPTISYWTCRETI